MERCSLGVLSEFAACVALMALLSLRRMRRAAIISTSKREIAPPMIPPSSGLVRPLVGEVEAVGDVLAIGAGIPDSLGTLLRITGTVVDGAPITVSEIIFVVIVCTSEFASVDLDVCVSVIVSGSVV